MPGQTSITVLVCVAAVGLAACGGGDSSGSDVVEIELAEQNGSGQSGTATLTELDDGQTRIVMEVSNPPPNLQPAHVHSGACGELGPPVASLTNVVGGQSETVVSMSLAELQTGNLVVHAHKSQQNYETSVFCAEIPLVG